MIENKKRFRPKDWPKSRCAECKKKQEDEYGLLCNLSCGQYTTEANFEAGADAMLNSEEILKVLEFYSIWSISLED